MPVHNSEIADLFRTIADLLEIRGENRFRIRAYREAARTIDGLSGSLEEMIKRGEDLSGLPGIGKDLAGKIRTFVEKKSLPQLEELRKKVPEELSRLMRIQGLGAKKVKTLYDQLDVGGIEDLRRAAEKGRIRKLEGFGEKTERKILREIGRIESAGRRFNIFRAAGIARSLAEYLGQLDGIKKLAIAGSFRRGRETVGDLDILVAARRGVDAGAHLIEYDEVAEVISRGTTRSSVRLSSGMNVDLREVAAVSFGAALLYFTGSKGHNIALRTIARKKKWKINEYGLFDGEKRIAGRTEKEIYERLGLRYIEPELRENRGEIEAARDGALPDLVSREDLRGDLHVHTDRTDGHYGLAEMAGAARERGLDYIAITEHSKQVRVAGGLDADELAEWTDEIERRRGKFEGIEILTGIEVDILEDGSLDLPDEVLGRLDVVVCSVHSHFGLSRKKQTERIIRAMDNDRFQILGHPTGRLIGEREPYEIDIETVMEAAKDRGCVLEINSHPDRLDLDDAHCRTAREIGVKLAISTDAHYKEDFDLLDFGLRQARRGWLEAKDIVNTRPAGELRKLLARS